MAVEGLRSSYLWISMFLHIHLSKRAHVADTRDIDGELVKEVYDVGGLMAQPKTQDKWSDERTEQFFQQKCLTNMETYTLSPQGIMLATTNMQKF